MCGTFPKSMALKMPEGHASRGQVKDNGTDDCLGSEWVGAIGYEGTEHLGVLSGSDPSLQPSLCHVALC